MGSERIGSIRVSGAGSESREAPDGIHWKLIDNWTTEAIVDGPSHWMIDPARDKYVLYGRTHLLRPTERKWFDGDGARRHHPARAVWPRVESSDFLNWDIVGPGQSPVIMAADTQDLPGDEIYSMKVFPYESVYIGAGPGFSQPSPTPVTSMSSWPSVTTSYHFTRVGNRESFLPVGPIGSWDRFNNSLANNDPIAVGDELRIYYGGRTIRHQPYKGEDKGPPGGGVGFATVIRGPVRFRRCVLRRGRAHHEDVTDRRVPDPPQCEIRFRRNRGGTARNRLRGIALPRPNQSSPTALIRSSSGRTEASSRSRDQSP